MLTELRIPLFCLARSINHHAQGLDILEDLGCWVEAASRISFLAGWALFVLLDFQQKLDIMLLSKDHILHACI